MAKEVVIHVWCDVCLHGEGDERVGGREVLVEIEGARATLALCSTHEAALLTPLRHALTEYGDPQGATTQRSAGGVSDIARPPGERAARRPRKEPLLSLRDLHDAPFVCVICDEQPRFGSREAWNHHSEFVHNIKLAASIFPRDACPLCDYRSTRPHGVSRHVFHSHRMHVSDAFYHAIAEGKFDRRNLRLPPHSIQDALT